MREVAWIAFHIVIALPIALILSVVLRETLRAALALATGFRVFEIRFGVGDRLCSHPFGPIDLSLGALPLGGATLAASGDARRYRIRRIALAISPLLPQLAWLLWTIGPGSADLIQIQTGFAPVTVFAIAQSLLFALHVFLPIRWGTDEQTDIRTLIDILFGAARDDRRTRAAYYVRSVRHAIERGRIKHAYDSLHQGLTQLGPEPLLIECQTILATRELTSVIDQGESAEALRILLEWSPAQDRESNSSPRAFARFGRRGIYALPLLGALAAYAAFHHDAISVRLTERWIQKGEAIVETASADACALHRAQSEGWPLSLEEGAAPVMRRDHHLLTARLFACEDAMDQAEEFAAKALSASEEARATHYVGAIPDPERWVDDELRLVEILGFRGALSLKRGKFRLALQTLKRADRELDLVREQLSQGTSEEEQTRLAQRIDTQDARILEQRQLTQTEMAAR